MSGDASPDNVVSNLRPAEVASGPSLTKPTLVVCGTRAIGPITKGGVLGSDFRAHGTARLRVIDASVFPHIPGYFIASAMHMFAEKAADGVLADAMA